MGFYIRRLRADHSGGVLSPEPQFAFAHSLGDAMDGLFGTDPLSLRPSDTDPLPSLPRRVLRHLITVNHFGVGTRVVVGGDEAQSVASFFTRLGIDAFSASESNCIAREHDAAVWLDLEPSPAGERSLLSAEALSRTAGLLNVLKPSGTFLLVAKLGDGAIGHRSACLEAHLGSFAERSRLTVFPERSFAGFFGGSRPGYAVASCNTLWRGIPAASSDVCCGWAAEPVQESRAA